MESDPNGMGTTGQNILNGVPYRRDGIHMVTKIRKNIKNSLMNLYDKLMLRKRAVLETINDEFKNIAQVEHSRHRSIDNFATNLVAGLIVYNLLPKKPAMNIDIIDKSKIIA